VRASGPSYVTLTVLKDDAGGSDKTSGKRGNAIASGSGFLADTAGHVLTAAHVAGAAGNEISARAANGRVYSGKVVAILPGNDMALIKLRGIAGRPVTPTGNNCLATGSMVFSLGRPHAQGDTARVGEVEAMHFGRPVQYGKFGYPDAMVLKMNTQKGESGGPLFDGSGRLVGMVVSTLTDAQGQPLRLAHAVPATSLAGFLCSNVACSPDWQALAGQSTGSCPKT
jgi:serine protease Do